MTLSQAPVGRASHLRREPHPLTGGVVRVLEVRGALLPVRHGRLVLRAVAPGDAARTAIVLGGPYAGADRVVAVLAEPLAEEPSDGEWLSLRSALAWSPAEVELATTAVAMAQWHATTRFCRCCGGPLAVAEGGWLLRCAEEHDSYPSTSPAVIMAVTDAEDRLLLARGSSWGPQHRSVLAGFVEPGESLEAAVVREVREEVGVEVVDVRYEGNQPWPFPASLMVGFSCRAVGTDLCLDPREIAQAEWYRREDLGVVSLPGPLSIAHHLVAQWYGGPPPGARPA